MGGGFCVKSVLAGAILLASGLGASAADCPGNPNALGTSRILAVNPAETPRIGTHDYGVSLPLAPREVILTFDDGPMAPYTERVLEVLQAHCVKATFFMIGRNARSAPQLARRVLAAGHTIGTHTQNHPLRKMNAAQTVREISNGIVAVRAALGTPNAVAPFFRFPGLHHTPHGQRYLRLLGIAAWSIDVDSHDWKRDTAQNVLHNILSRLETKGRGIVLMHDVQAKTVLLLPQLLTELKARGYRVVHVVPSGPQMAPPEHPIASHPPPEPDEITTASITPAPLWPLRPTNWPIAILTRPLEHLRAIPLPGPLAPSVKPEPEVTQPSRSSVQQVRGARATPRKPDREAVVPR